MYSRCSTQTDFILFTCIGIETEFEAIDPEPTTSKQSSPEPSENTSEINKVPTSTEVDPELQNPELSSSNQSPEELVTQHLKILHENQEDVPSTNEILVSSDQVIVIEGTDEENIDAEVIALVQASVELISQQEDQFNSSSPPDFYEETNDQIPTSVAQVEVSCPATPEPIKPKDGSTIFLVQGVDTSIDYCPNCSTKLCPFRGGYSVNCINFDVQIKCHGCWKNIVIKKSFSQHQKSVLWMNTAV